MECQLMLELSTGDPLTGNSMIFPLVVVEMRKCQGVGLASLVVEEHTYSISYLKLHLTLK
jgi:hypothetical protein